MLTLPWPTVPAEIVILELLAMIFAAEVRLLVSGLRKK